MNEKELEEQVLRILSEGEELARARRDAGDRFVKALEGRIWRLGSTEASAK